jgi:hypothetical protein
MSVRRNRPASGISPGFIQDDFKVSPRLTLSYGLRYEFDKAGVDTHDTIANFDPVSGSIVVPNEKVRRESINPLFPAGYPNHPGGLKRECPNGHCVETTATTFNRASVSRSAHSRIPRPLCAGATAFTRTTLRETYFPKLYGGPFRVTENFTNSLDARDCRSLLSRNRFSLKARSARWR